MKEFWKQTGFSFRNKVSLSTAIAAFGIALLALVGWSMDWRFLTTYIPGTITMMPLTAISIFLVSGTLVLANYFFHSIYRNCHSENRGVFLKRWNQRLLLFSATVLLVVSLFTILQTIFGISWQMEKWLFTDKILKSSFPFPGRLSLGTGVALLLVAVLLYYIVVRKEQSFLGVFMLSVIVILIPFVALMGYVFNVPILYFMLPGSNPMALPTVLALMLLGFSMLTLEVNPNSRIFSSRDEVVRSAFFQMLLLSLAVIFLTSFIHYIVSETDLISHEMGHALSVLVQVVLILWIILWNSRNVDRSWKKIEDQYRMLSSLINTPTDIIIFALDRKYRYLAFNRNHYNTMKTIWGVTIRKGMSILDCMSLPDLRIAAQSSMDRALAGERFSEEQYQPDHDIYYEFNWSPIWNGNDVVGLVAYIKDVSVRRRIEAELKRYNQFLMETQEISRTGGWEYVVAEKKISWTEETYRIHGVTRDFDPNDIEKNIGFYGENDQEKIRNSFKELLEYGKSYELDLPFVQRSGKRIWVRTTGVPEFGTDGKIIRAHGNIMDITERIEHEQDLLRTSRFIQSVFDSLTSHVCVLDENAKIIAVNKAWVDFCLENGGNPDAMGIGRDYLDVCDRANDPVAMLVAGGIRALMKDGNILYEEEYPCHSDTVQRWFHLRITKFMDQEKVRMVVDHQDITKRKLAELNLHASEEKFRSMFESDPIGKALVDSYGVFKDVNTCLDRMLGYSREELLGLSENEIASPEEREKSVKVFESIRKAERGSCRFERRYRRKDGSLFWGDVSLARLPSESTASALFILTVMDVTDRKNYHENILRLNKKLSEKGAELQELIYVSSHDLRTPLVNLQGFYQELESILDSLKKRLEECASKSGFKEDFYGVFKEAEESMEFIRISMGRMNMLLSGLLKVSRAGEGHFSKQQVDMNEIVSNIINNFDFMVRMKGIKIHVQRSLPICFGNPQFLDQIFSNLIDNAIKYLDPERPGEIAVEGKIEGEYVTYAVTDNGIGIPASAAEKVFEIFKRLNPDKAPGDGLGLSLVKKIVGKLDGKVWLTSRQGEGTVFYVQLPNRDQSNSESVEEVRR